MALTWYIYIDWNNDGTFEADEAARCRHLFVSRGRKRQLREDGTGFEPMSIGTLTLTLDNYDGRFDALNASSPLYPYVLPARDIKIQVHDGTTLHTLFRGRIQDILPVGDRQGGQVTLQCADGGELLKDPVSKGVQSNCRTDTMIGLLLDEAGWPSAWGRSLGVGSDYIPYVWADGRPASEQIHDLNESEQGQFYIAADGKATFIGRGSLYGGSSVVSIDQSQILTDIGFPQPWNSVKNDLRLTIYLPVLRESVVLWQLQSLPLLAPGQSLTYVADYAYDSVPCSAKDVITPVSGTDYTLNTAADGSGTDLNASLTVSFTDGGTKAFITVTNSHGSSAGYLTLRVRGTAITFPDYQILRKQDSSSQTQYGRRTLQIDVPWTQNLYKATDMLNFLTSSLADPTNYPTIRLEDRASIQFARDLFHRITLSIAKYSISADYYIAGIEHEWLFETGQSVRTTWILEPVLVDNTSYWIFSTNIGVSSRFAY